MSQFKDSCCLPRAASTTNQHAVFKPQNKIQPPFVELPKAVFLMGSEDSDINPADGESPVREVEVNAMAIATTVVTNAQFRRFVRETQYRTEAEISGWSFVFRNFLTKQVRNRQRPSQEVDAAPWWLAVDGACWRRPEGPGSNLRNRDDHPVVHVSWNDAQAYCTWTGCRLPTEAEWEFAARGGLVQQPFPWGNELTPGGIHQCNIWQGQFPDHNTCEDGFLGTAPVGAFEPNQYGLFNMSGNVWEWCEDWYHENSRGKTAFRPGKLLKGGSYLCHESYCNRYRVAARYANAPNTSTGNCGFRVVRKP